MTLGQARRYLRPARVFIIAVAIGLAVGLLLHLAFRPLLLLLQEALYFRISKPLELIQGPLTGVVGTEEAVTLIYLVLNNTFVSLIAAFGGAVLVRLENPDEIRAASGKLTNFLHRIIGEGDDTYLEQSVIIFLLPLAVVFMNGLVLGIFTVGNGLSLKDLSVYAAYILPHGIIELPAVVFAAIIGYSVAVKLNAHLSRGQLESFHREARRTLRSRRVWALFSVVVLMLVSASFIETYVTPVIGRAQVQRAYFSLRVLNETIPQGEPAYLTLWASFDSNLSFSRGSPDGTPAEVEVFGSERYPFAVGGEIVEQDQIVVTSSIYIPENVSAVLLKFRCNLSGTVYVVAEHDALRDVGNITVIG